MSGFIHSTTGVGIIAALLFITVIIDALEATGNWISGSIGIASMIQLFFGVAIVTTIVLALWRESACLLLPYLFFQGIGLAAIFVGVLTLLYLCIDNDVEGIKAFVGSSEYQWLTGYMDDSHLVSWLILAFLAMFLGIQLWLIIIVSSCWRYFRDKESQNIDASERTVRERHLTLRNLYSNSN